MPSEKTDAIVVRVVDFSETSCIVTMITRDFGKITAIAKGARRPKSPFEAAIDVLAICRIVFLHKTGAMSLLTEAKLEHRFRAGETNLARLYAGFYVVELLRSLTDEGDPQPEVFELGTRMIRQLDQPSFEDVDLPIRLIQFELGLLDLLGHLPMLTRCANCGREKTTLTDVQFGLTAGGVLCQPCRRGKANIVTVQAETFGLLLQLAGAQIGTEQENSDNWNQADRVHEHRLKHKSWLTTLHPSATSQTNDESKVTKFVDELGEPDSHRQRTIPVPQTPQAINEIRSLLNQYVTHLIGHPPRLHKFLKTS